MALRTAANGMSEALVVRLLTVLSCRQSASYVVRRLLLPRAGSARGNKLMLSASASCIRKSGIAFSSVAAVLLAAACGPEQTDEGATTATHPLVAGSTVVYEAEVLARTASATGSYVTAEPGASAGKYVQLSGTAGRRSVDSVHSDERRGGQLRPQAAVQVQLQPRHRPGQHRWYEPGFVVQSIFPAAT